MTKTNISIPSQIPMRSFGWGHYNFLISRGRYTYTVITPTGAYPSRCSETEAIYGSPVKDVEFDILKKKKDPVCFKKMTPGSWYFYNGHLVTKLENMIVFFDPECVPASNIEGRRFYEVEELDLRIK